MIEPDCFTELVTITVITPGSGRAGGMGLSPVVDSNIAPHVGAAGEMAKPLNDAGAEPWGSGLAFHQCAPQKLTFDPTPLIGELITKAPCPKLTGHPVPVLAVLPPSSLTETWIE